MAAKKPSGLIIVAPDHRRPAFGRDALEFLLAHPQSRRRCEERSDVAIS
jgi:ribosomal protein S18 acetylase RimI-like enzyme